MRARLRSFQSRIEILLDYSILTPRGAIKSPSGGFREVDAFWSFAPGVLVVILQPAGHDSLILVGIADLLCNQPNFDSL